MPLSILLPLVVFGIAGIVALISLLRPSPPLRLSSPEQARRIWNHRNPDNPARALHLNARATHALVETDKCPGLLWVFGIDPVTRELGEHTDIHTTGKGLHLRLHDVTAPTLDIPLTPEELPLWQAILKGPA